MPNEQNNAAEVDNKVQEAPEPVDIAQAFKMYNQSQREASQPPVQDAGDGEQADESGVAGADGESSPAGDIQAEVGDVSAPDLGADGGSAGGSANVIEPIDYSPAKQDILKNIQNQAIDQVRKEMHDQGIEMWTMNDIYERDENSGRVTFKNPDDPNHPFANRTEAQAWINSINEEINNHFRMEVNKKQRELVQQNAPTFQMIDFAATYQAMSKQEQDIFNDLIEPYAVQDNTGKVIGFNANLQSVANVAKNLAKKFGNQQQTQQQQQQATQQASQQAAPSTPALDIPSGAGSSGIEGDPEPKTIGEALKMVDARNRKKKESK